MGLYDDLGKLLTENNTLQSIKSFMKDSFIVSREDYVLTTGDPSIAPVTPVTLTGLTGEYYNNTDLEEKRYLSAMTVRLILTGMVGPLPQR